MSEKDPELVNFFLDEASDFLSHWEKICLELEAGPSLELFNALFRIAHNLKGSSRSVGLLELGEFVHKVEDVIVSVRDGKAEFKKSVLAMFFDAQTLLNAMLEALRNDPDAVVDTAEFMCKHFDDLPQTDPVNAEIMEASIEAAAPQITMAEKTTSAQVSEAKAQKAQPRDEVLRVSTRKIDNLLNLIGELSIQNSILANALGKESAELDVNVSSSLNLSKKLTKEIYNNAFDLRMTPIGGIYQRVERAIKDLSRDVNKTIEVRLEGSEVEIEKTILEKLIDPLTHIVRNSVDHGIETPEERASSGKNLTGVITISAQKEGDGVEIMIKDDGKGLNQKRILEKAMEKGIVKNPDQLTKEEIFRLIFLPGFSTAEKLTNISGRGVGMDVVMRTIEEIDGKIQIASEEGRGTKFKISIPTSLSIIDSLIVEINAITYVLPINFLEEVLDCKPSELHRDKTIYMYRGRAIPYFHLGDIFNQEFRQVVRNTTTVLVTQCQGKCIAFGVDAIVGQHQSVVRQLNSYFDLSYSISGGTILPSGEPGLILNMAEIFRRFYKNVSNDNEVAA
jgi:two-component system chemotaxis sensor kinase CheA